MLPPPHPFLQLLIEEAQKRYPKQIKFHFMQEATAVDMQAKQVWEGKRGTCRLG